MHTAMQTNERVIALFFHTNKICVFCMIACHGTGWGLEDPRLSHTSWMRPFTSPQFPRYASCISRRSRKNARCSGSSVRQLQRQMLNTTLRTTARSVVFSICLCSCLTDDPEQRAFFLERLDMQDAYLGNCGEVKGLIQDVWDKRGSSSPQPV